MTTVPLVRHQNNQSNASPPLMMQQKSQEINHCIAHAHSRFIHVLLKPQLIRFIIDLINAIQTAANRIKRYDVHRVKVEGGQTRGITHSQAILAVDVAVSR